MQLLFKILTLYMSFYSVNAVAAIWQVGPTRTYTFCSQVAPLVQDGDTVEIDSAVYVNDPQVHWNKNNLYLVGVGGRPRLEAGSIIAQDSSNGKGIFVISGNFVTVENIEFALATVPDHNGAGIRQEGANLIVRHCKFDGNEMGILTGSIPNSKTTIEYSEFVNGGSVLNPGYQHNIYINHIDTLLFRYNYSHDAIAEGHELKSRASFNFIMYNRIANEQSVDSRTIDLPNGGTCVIVGNVIEQGMNSANSNLFGYGLEGLTNPAPHNAWICSNTFVNKKTTGSFIQVSNGTDTLFLKNNIMAGPATGGLIIGSPAVLDSSHNLTGTIISNFGFQDPVSYDYHPIAGSVACDAGLTMAQMLLGHSLNPQWMYEDTCSFEIRTPIGNLDIGAFEFLPPNGIEIPENLNPVVYPNPCDEILKFSNLKNETYQVFNIHGQCLLTGNGSEVNVSQLPGGIYMLRTEMKCSIFQKK